MDGVVSSAAAPAAPQGQSAQVDANKKPTGQGGGAPQAPQVVQNVGQAPENKADADKKTEAEKVRRILRAKMRGGVEREYDLDNPEHLQHVQREFQRQIGAQEALEQAAQMRREIEEERKQLRDPSKVMEYLKTQGIDPDQLARERLYAQMQQEAMSPEQRQIAELQQRLEQEQQSKQQQEQAQQEAQIQQYQEGFSRWLDAETTKALQTEGLPKSQYLISMVAHKMRIANQARIEMSPADAVSEVKAESADHLRQLVGAMEPSKVLEILGDEFGIKLSRHMAEKIRGTRRQSQPQQFQRQSTNNQQDSKKMEPHEWRQHLRQLAGG